MYSIQKEGQYLTGNMRTGRYEFTSFREHHYTFEENRARVISENFPGSEIVKE